MPTMANITVKKDDGTTDIVYTAVQPSAGDKVPAIWRQEDTGVMVGQRPVLKQVCSDNGPKTARKVHLEYARPFTYTDSVKNLPAVESIFLGSADFLVPNNMTAAAIAEGVSQFSNLLKDALIQACIKAGVSPT